MILYHDSFTEVRKPDISYSRDTLDFGKGFYVTPIYEQAKKWSLRFKRKKGKSVISWYELDEKKLRHEARIKEFSSYSEGSMILLSEELQMIRYLIQLSCFLTG